MNKFISMIVAMGVAMGTMSTANAGILSDKSAEGFRATCTGECYESKYRSGINQIELSEYDKAWLKYWVVDEDTISGMHNGIFWMVVGNEIVDVHKSKWSLGGEYNNAKDAIMAAISESLTNQIKAEIESNIEDAKARALSLLGENQEAALEALNDVEINQKALDSLNDIGEIDVKSSVGSVVSFSDVDRDKAKAYAKSVGHPVLVQEVDEYGDAKFIIYATPDNKSFLVYSKQSVELFKDLLKAEYTKGYHDGYVAGYNKGYEDGYAAGYAKGFADGVASVE